MKVNLDDDDDDEYDGDEKFLKSFTQIENRTVMNANWI